MESVDKDKIKGSKLIGGLTNLCCFLRLLSYDMCSNIKKRTGLNQVLFSWKRTLHCKRKKKVSETSLSDKSDEQQHKQTSFEIMMSSRQSFQLISDVMFMFYWVCKNIRDHLKPE